MGRVDFMGIQIDALTTDEVVERVARYVEEGGPHEQVSINALKVVSCARDEELRRMIAECELVCPDGGSVVLASRFLGDPLPERVNGTELWLRLMERAAVEGWRPYLLGAKPEVVERTAAWFQREYPSLELAGWRDGYFTADEEREVAEAIRDSGADLLFIGMSSPKKEHFLSRWGELMNVPYMQGVGGSFDLIGGGIKRAPRWMRDNHLEWAWRLYQEPRRMWRRNLSSSVFVLRVMQARFLGYRVPE